MFSCILLKFPIFENDPFLVFRPFPQLPQSNFAAHWHEILLSFISYCLIQKFLRLLCVRYVKKAYTNLPPKTRLNFDIHIVSMVQCTVSLLIIVPMWNHPSWVNHVQDAQSAIFGYTPYAGMVAAVTLGYFMWDIYVCIAHFKVFGWAFLIHGLAAGYVFACGLCQYCMPWMPAFLLFELSTPFVNVNWFASRLPHGTINDVVVIINGFLLLLVFFSVRIVWGFYAVYVCSQDMWLMWLQLGPFLPVLILFLNALLNSLNVFWFYKMLLIAKTRSTKVKSFLKPMDSIRVKDSNKVKDSIKVTNSIKDHQ